MVSERGRKVFAGLKQVDLDREDRDPHHNLTDPLEIVAVAEGVKPAFLGGQSAHSNEDVLADLAAAGEQHGLRVRRSRGIHPFAEFLTLDPPLPDRAYFDHHLTDMLRAEDGNAPVLWLFADPAMEARIEEGELGKLSSADVLGYPRCCVDYFMRLLAQKYLVKVEAIRREHGVTGMADVIAAEPKGVNPSRADSKKIESIEDRLARDLGESIIKFPFIHFTACPPCRASSSSPAANVNWQMRSLAFNLDRSFANRFTRYAEKYRKAHERRFGRK